MTILLATKVCVYNAIVNEACTADGCSVMYGTYQRSGLVMDVHYRCVELRMFIRCGGSSEVDGFSDYVKVLQ